MKVSDIAKRLSFEIVTDLTDTEFESIYAGDFLSRAMSRMEEGTLWVTVMNNINVIAVATLADVAAIVLCEGVRLSPDALEAAKEKKVSVLSTPFSAYEVCCKLGEELKKD